MTSRSYGRRTGQFWERQQPRGNSFALHPRIRLNSAFPVISFVSCWSNSSCSLTAMGSGRLLLRSVLESYQLRCSVEQEWRASHLWLEGNVTFGLLPCTSPILVSSQIVCFAQFGSEFLAILSGSRWHGTSALDHHDEDCQHHLTWDVVVCSRSFRSWDVVACSRSVR